MLYYLGTSALVKRYVREAGSAWILSLCSPSPVHIIAVSLITKAELIAGLAAKQRNGSLSLAEFQAVELDIASDFLQQYQTVTIDQATVNFAAELAKRNALRGYDAVQLACALSLNASLTTLNLPPLTFLSADARLLQAAIREDLPTDNPNQHP
jgi:uncharacterized protein